MKKIKMNLLVTMALFAIMALFVLSIFVIRDNLGKLAIGSSYWSGIIYSGNIDRDKVSVFGEYKEADGNGRFLFSLKKGKYIITKDIDTKKGDIQVKLTNNDGALISDLELHENSINFFDDNKCYIEISVKKHSGKFKVSIKNVQSDNWDE